MAQLKMRRFWRLGLGGTACALWLALAPALGYAETAADQTDGEMALSELILTAVGPDEEIRPPAAESALGDYLAALVARRNRDLSAAADFMLSALEADPENPELLAAAFILVAGDGRQAETIGLAKRLTAAKPGEAFAHTVLALDAVEQGDLDRASEILTALPARGLSSLVGPLLKGWVEVARGDAAAALQSLDVLEETKGFDSIRNLHSALMYDVAGDATKAQEGYDNAFAKSGGSTLRLSWLSGNFFERQGDRERAVQIYREFIQANPGTTLLQPFMDRAEAGEAAPPAVADARQGMAEVLFNIASLLTQERAEELALAHVQQALHIKPDFDVARVLLGEILQGQARGREAIETYRKIAPDSSFGWMVRLRIADQMEELEDIEGAIAELDALSNERKDQFEPMFRKGNVLRANERFKEAVVAYDEAERRLGDIEPRHWTLLYFRGIALERSDQWDRAEENFLKALELEPEQPFVMNYLAYSWVEQKKNLDEAKEMLVRAVDLRPDDGYIVDSLGWVYYRVGEYENAVKYLEQAVELRPQDPVINDHLGDAYWRTGRVNEARFQWRRSLSLEPEEDQIPIITGKIKEGMPPEPKDI